jgi:arylformamidase
MTLVDLSHEIYHHMPRVPVLPEVEISCVFRIADGKPLNSLHLAIPTHAGSHVDAPYHALDDGKTIEQFPLETFVGRGAVIPVQHGGGEAITAAELENSGVAVERGDILLLRSGWDAYFTSPEYLVHPYLSLEACDWIVERGVKLVALDWISPELPHTLRAPDFDYPAHRALLRHDVLIIENLRNLGAIVDGRWRIIALPLRVRGGDGAHTRVAAEPLH